MLVALLLLAPPPLALETVRFLAYEKSDLCVPLRRVRGDRSLFYFSKMSCDVDGSPNAYHPLNDDLALDTIDSAGGRRAGDVPNGRLTVMPSPDVVAYENGVPYVQASGDFKGFYVSSTSLQNESLPNTDPHRYLDARSARFIVLPGGMVPEATLGDLAIVCDPWSKKATSAVYGDIGPGTESGEASLATIQALGLPAFDGKSSPAQCRDDIFYVVFPGTHSQIAGAWPPDSRTMDRVATGAFRAWGGVDRVRKILAQTMGIGSIPDTAENRPLYDALAAFARAKLLVPDFGLPARYGHTSYGRLPCAPEIVVSIRDGIERLLVRLNDASWAGSDQARRLIPSVGALVEALKRADKAAHDEGIDGAKVEATANSCLALMRA